MRGYWSSVGRSPRDVTAREDVLVERFDRWADVAARASSIDLVRDRVEDEALPKAQTVWRYSRCD